MRAIPFRFLMVMVMLATLIAAATGCAHTKTRYEFREEVVPVPVPVPTKIEIPDEPEWQINLLASDAADGDEVRALAADFITALAYIHIVKEIIRIHNDALEQIYGACGDTGCSVVDDGAIDINGPR